MALWLVSTAKQNYVVGLCVRRPAGSSPFFSHVFPPPILIAVLFKFDWKKEIWESTVYLHFHRLIKQCFFYEIDMSLWPRLNCTFKWSRSAVGGEGIRNKVKRTNSRTWAHWRHTPPLVQWGLRPHQRPGWCWTSEAETQHLSRTRKDPCVCLDRHWSRLYVLNQDNRQH